MGLAMARRPYRFRIRWPNLRHCVAFGPKTAGLVPNRSAAYPRRGARVDSGLSLDRPLLAQGRRLVTTSDRARKRAAGSGEPLLIRRGRRAPARLRSLGRDRLAHDVADLGVVLEVGLAGELARPAERSAPWPCRARDPRSSAQSSRSALLRLGVLRPLDQAAQPCRAPPWRTPWRRHGRRARSA